MPFSTAFANSLLSHLLNNTAMAGLGDAGGPLGSASAGSLFLALHTAAPGVGGTQSTNEVSYSGYARVAVARSAAGWTVTSNTFTNAAQIQFPICAGGTSTATHFSIGYASSGGATVLEFGTLNTPLAISINITPQFAAGQLTATLT
jgi:hypothetical protein